MKIKDLFYRDKNLVKCCHLAADNIDFERDVRISHNEISFDALILFFADRYQLTGLRASNRNWTEDERNLLQTYGNIMDLLKEAQELEDKINEVQK